MFTYSLSTDGNTLTLTAADIGTVIYTKAAGALQSLCESCALNSSVDSFQAARAMVSGERLDRGRTRNFVILLQGWSEQPARWQLHSRASRQRALSRT